MKDATRTPVSHWKFRTNGLGRHIPPHLKRGTLYNGLSKRARVAWDTITDAFAVVRIVLGSFSFYVPRITATGFKPLAIIMFSFYAVAGLIGFIFAPRDTQGRTLEEIQGGAPPQAAKIAGAGAGAGADAGAGASAASYGRPGADGSMSRRRRREAGGGARECVPVGIRKTWLHAHR